MLLSILSNLIPLFASGIDRIPADQALAQWRTGQAIVLDVREDNETKDGKVKDARVFHTSELNSPQFEKLVADLPKDKQVYTYCAIGGRADKVAQALRKKGIRANGTGGLKDWVAAGAETTR